MLRLRAPKRRTVLIVAAVVVVLGAVAAYGKKTTPPLNGKSNAGNKTIAFLMPCTACADRYQAKDTPYFVKAVHDLDPQIKVIAQNADGSGDVQLQQAETAIKDGASVVVIDPMTVAAGTGAVSRGRTFGASVIGYDTMIMGIRPNYYVGYDNRAVGWLQAHYLADRLKPGATVVMLNGAPSSPAAKAYQQGALDVLQPLFDSGRLRLGYSADTPNFDPVLAGQEMTEALTSLGGRVDAVLAATDTLAGAAIGVLGAHGLAGKVLVTGQDASDTALAAIRTGSQSMTVRNPIQAEAEAAAQLAVHLVHRNTSAAKAQAGWLTSNGPYDRIPSVLVGPLVAVDRGNVGALP